MFLPGIKIVQYLDNFIYIIDYSFCIFQTINIVSSVFLLIILILKYVFSTISDFYNYLCTKVLLWFIILYCTSNG